MSVQHILCVLSTQPSLLTLEFIECLRFIRLACLAKPSIECQTQDRRNPPVHIPPFITEVLALSLSWDITVVQACWTAFKEVIWAHEDISPSENEIALFNSHALSRSTSYRHIYPPVRVCLDFSCQKYRDNHEILTLVEPVTHKAALFTLRDGVLPVYTTSLYCRGCHRRYYHNYFVSKQLSSRTYYGGVPDCIQVAQHFFIESAVLELFGSGMVFGWLSSTNCARIYNQTLALRQPHVANNNLAFHTVYLQRVRPPIHWSVSLKMRPEDVMNGFLTYSLILDKAEHNSILIMSHNEASQRDRLQPALQERNKAMEGIGQECYAHACDQCFIVSQNAEGMIVKIQPAVCDGNTIGHPTCSVHDCKIPLATNILRFCPDHNYLDLKCAIVDCEFQQSPGFRTCSTPQHRAMEEAYYKRGSALFQLRDRLKKAGVTVPLDSIELEQGTYGDSPDVLNGVDDGEPSTDCDGKSIRGNRKVHAYFGQCRTHNEQLIMRPCGIILSRATFFGSEAVSAVNTFAKATFPSPESTPEFFIFDNNCKLVAHQKAIGDTHFENTGKPVDVFHFKSKHKLTDTYCQRFCNPAAFPELITGGKWTVNMSICEQTNVWFGGYIAIVWDMEVTRYNFFLDEMIKRRNCYVVKELEVKGRAPWTVPMQALFPAL